MTSKEKDIRKLLDLLGSVEVGKMMLDEFFDAITDLNVRNRLKEASEKEVDFSEIIEREVCMYNDNFTHNEIKQMIEFHASPIGRKIFSLRPLLLKESAENSKLWGQKTMRKILEHMEGSEEQRGKEGQEQENKSFFNDSDRRAVISVDFANQERFQGVNKIMRGRYEFAQQYAVSKGWDVDNLTLDQIKEIRAQDGWKNAGKNESN